MSNVQAGRLGGMESMPVGRYPEGRTALHLRRQLALPIGRGAVAGIGFTVAVVGGAIYMGDRLLDSFDNMVTAVSEHKQIMNDPDTICRDLVSQARILGLPDSPEAVGCSPEFIYTQVVDAQSAPIQ